MLKKLFLAGVVVMFASSSVAAQETPAAGTGGPCIWCGLPIGSNVMIGGVMFVVLAAGLALADDDDEVIVIPTPTPTPTPTPSTTTSSTTTT